MSENWSARTRLVHGGARRSQYGETSEAILIGIPLYLALTEQLIAWGL
jgi:hypothetical protein